MSQKDKKHVRIRLTIATPYIFIPAFRRKKASTLNINSFPNILKKSKLRKKHCRFFELCPIEVTTTAR